MIMNYLRNSFVHVYNYVAFLFLHQSVIVMHVAINKKKSLCVVIVPLQ